MVDADRASSTDGVAASDADVHVVDELVGQSHARRQGGHELVARDAPQHRVRLGGHRGGARDAAQQPELTAPVVRAEPVDHLTPGVDGERAARHDVEVVGGITLPDDDASGRRVHDGELFVRSPAQMSGYLDDRGQALAPLELRDGHFSVGDLGTIDDGGWITLVDRKHDTIITGGLNVYPAEVERALATLPGVAGVVAFVKLEYAESPTALKARTR